MEALIELMSFDQGAADPAALRTVITSRIPRATLEDYERARRRGLLPPAVATRGQAFLCCPHCERVLFNPDWMERR